jgi:hypothetical protein
MIIFTNQRPNQIPGNLTVPSRYKEIKKLIIRSPFQYLLLMIFVGGVLAAFIYLQSATPNYVCKTKTVGGLQTCQKYQISPPLYLGQVSNSSCPNNPPTYCP